MVAVLALALCCAYEVWCNDLIGLDQVVVARERRAEAGNGIPSGPGGRALAHTGAFVLFVCDLWCNSIIIFIYLFILLF